MAEIGSGGGSSYPSSLDVDANLEYDSPAVNKTVARAAPINDLAAAVIAIETALGTTPQGLISDVKTFLQTEHTTAGAHKNFVGKVIYCGVEVGTDTMTMAATPALTAYAAGMIFSFKKSSANNTGAVTANVDSVGAVAVVDSDGTALVANLLLANQTYAMIYTAGAQMQLIGVRPAASSSVLTFNNLLMGGL